MELNPFIAVRPWQTALHRPNVPERRHSSSQTRGETATYVEVFFFFFFYLLPLRSHVSSQRAPLLVASSSLKTNYAASTQKIAQLSSKLEGLFLLSIRLDKGKFCNHEPLLCKLVFCWHQGSTSAAKYRCNLRGERRHLLSDNYHSARLGFTVSSSEWLIEDMKWIVVSEEY